MEMGPHPSSGRRVIPTDERGGGPAISARLPLSGVAAHCSSRDRVERPTSVQSDDLLLPSSRVDPSCSPQRESIPFCLRPDPQRSPA